MVPCASYGAEPVEVCRCELQNVCRELKMIRVAMNVARGCEILCRKVQILEVDFFG